MANLDFNPVTCAPTAVDADGVCASQSPAGDAILINGALASGGVATFGAAQLVRLTSGGNDSGITFTFAGTDADGRTITEAVAGTNASNSDTTKYFKTITGITASGAVATTIIVGNLITSVSPMIRPFDSNPFNIGFGCTVTGTVTYSVEHSYEDPSVTTPTTWFTHATATGKSAAFEATYTYPVAAIRLKVTASTSGTATGRFLQA